MVVRRDRLWGDGRATGEGGIVRLGVLGQSRARGFGVGRFLELCDVGKTFLSERATERGVTSGEAVIGEGRKRRLLPARRHKAEPRAGFV